MRTPRVASLFIVHGVHHLCRYCFSAQRTRSTKSAVSMSPDPIFDGPLPRPPQGPEVTALSSPAEPACFSEGSALMVEVETRDILCAVHIDNVARKCEECKEKDVTRKDALAAALWV